MLKAKVQMLIKHSVILCVLIKENITLFTHLQIIANTFWAWHARDILWMVLVASAKLCIC